MADRCPSRRQLLDHHELRRDERVARHLERGCGACAAILERHEQTVAGLAAGPLDPPPASLLRAAGKLLGKHRRRETMERVRTFVARLVFDEGREPAVALRSVPGRSRRMLFEVGDGELFVTVTRGNRNWRLDGEMLAPVSELVLLRDGVEARRTLIDEDGRFSFPALGTGSFRLAGTVDGEEFVTDGFVL